MKIFKGKWDSWGISIAYCGWDKSLTFCIGGVYVALVFHKWWEN